MPAVCFYFQVHQPLRLRRFRIFDIGQKGEYFGEEGQGNLNNKWVLEKVSKKSYLPTNRLLLKLLKRHPDFRISFSFSGLVLEQFEEHMPEVLRSFQDLVDTGRAEVLSETYYHSLSFLYSKDEFERQVDLHRKKVKEIFGYEPQVFRNTELIYSNDIAKKAEEMGYRAILAEGADHVLGDRSPNYVYEPAGGKIKLLLKNYRLSDDIAFRFSSKQWADYPLTAPKFAQWVSSINGDGEIINLFMDYETFGEHQWEDTGIFSFLEALPEEILKHPDNRFTTPSEACEYPVRDSLDVPYYVSWADTERDLSAWLSNDMQREAIRLLYELEEDILKKENEDLLETWRRLQTSDHFYYMCTKWFADGDVHKYFNPYDTPYDAFIYYMNVLKDLKLKLSDERKTH